MAEKANCAIYIVHTSSALSLEHIRTAKAKGQAVFAETCPQYLLFNKSKYDLDFDKAATFVMSPPLREITDNQALWQAAASGLISTIGTDHCPFSFAQKMAGHDDFRLIPNGAGGVEHRLEVLFTYGVLEKKITLNKLVELTSANAAKIFGLFPAKGIIAPDADADIVIWNPNIRSTISPKYHHSKSDISIYNGMTISGKAEHVFCNGKIMIKNGKWNHRQSK
jgi:dihydropyrimidinase